jgi:virginiamycin B lyase
MADHPSAFSDGRRRVAASFVIIGLAFNSLVVPWVASTANASTPAVTNYTGTGIDAPQGITAGPDGALWFANEGLTGEGSSTIGRITTGGAIANYTGAASPVGITAGSDGALWFTNFGVKGSAGSIGRITTGGAATGHPGTGISTPVAIAAGPDGALWFTNVGNNSIGRITTDGAVTNYTGAGISSPSGIAAGPDGALWFTNFGNNSIGRITTGGVVTNYTGTGISSPNGIAAGSDGALWFTNFGSSTIGRITTGGVVTNYTGTGISTPEGIAAGPDGALWFTNSRNSTIGRITTGGVVTNYTGTGISSPNGIAAGPDGALWFTNDGNNSIGRITTGSNPPPTTSVLIPSNGATVSGGSAVLDASASSPEGMASVAFEVTGGSLSDQVVATATPTYVGWLAQWNTTTVPNGTYTLQSVAADALGQSTASAPITVTVNNPAPTSTVLIPAGGASVSGVSSLLDASASAKVSSVTYELSGGSLTNPVVISGSTPTIYGWIGQWNTTSVPNDTYMLQSVACYAGGVCGTSAPITITVDNTPPSTSMLIPSSGATLFGPAILDAAATDNVGVTKVEFHLTGGTVSDASVATATPTIYGWIADWNTRTVPNGTYTLQSVAYDAEGLSTHSTGITVSVLNGPIAYVAQIGGGSNGPDNVTPINTVNNTAGRPITGVSVGLAMAINPDGTTAYVTNNIEPAIITPIDLVTGIAQTPMTVGATVYAGAIAITPDGSTAYVGDLNSGDVIPVNLATKTAGTPIPTCTVPDDVAAGIVISPDGTTAYVACPLGQTVVPVNTSTNTAGGPIPAGEGPEGLAITPDGATLYAANFGAYGVVNGQVMQVSDGTTVTPINTATDTAGTPITVGSEPSSVAITPDGRTAYVVNLASNSITPIDIANSAGSPITLNATLTGTPGFQIAITPDGTIAYVVTRNNTLVPIDTANNTTQTPIPVGPVGPEPSAIAIH